MGSANRSTESIALGRGVQLDVTSLIATRGLICCNSGGGKSHALRLVVERVAGVVPVHILDPKGEFSTLRPFMDAVLVGRRGDIPAHPNNASVLAQKLLEARVSVIVDLEGLSRTDSMRFCSGYVEGLLDAPAETRHPVLVVVDEAHRFAPQIVTKSSDRELVLATHGARAALTRAMDSGRSLGVGMVLATQRLAKIAEDCSAEANNILLGRFAQSNDLRRACDLLGLDKKAWATIQSFEPGQFYAKGPAFAHVGTKAFRTYSKTATREPDLGVAVQPSRPSKELERVLAALSVLEPDPVPAAELVSKASRSVQSTQSPDPSVLVRAVAKARRAEYARGEKLANTLKAGLSALLRVPVQDVPARCEALSSVIDAYLETPLEVEAPTSSRPFSARRRVSKAQASAESGERSWTTAPGRILGVALQHYPNEVDFARLRALTNLQKSRSTLRNALSDLRTSGDIVTSSAGVMATDDAHQRLGAMVPPLPSGEELLVHWRAQLGTGAPRRIFEALVAAPGHSASIDSIGDLAQVPSGTSTLRNAISKVAVLGLVERHKRGAVRLCPALADVLPEPTP